MPWRSTPVGRLLLDDVVDEAGQLGPEGPTLPEEAVDRDCEGEADECAEQTSSEDREDWEANVWSKVEIESLRCEEDGDLGAEDNTGNGKKSEGELLASPAGSSCRASTSMREEIAHGQSC